MVAVTISHYRVIEKLGGGMNERLQRLFDRYNRLYWSGKLAGYRVISAKLENRLEECDWRKRTIKIDVLRHSSDRELHSTLLHEGFQPLKDT
jgi:hypothetical protein